MEQNEQQEIIRTARTTYDCELKFGDDNGVDITIIRIKAANPGNGQGTACMVWLLNELASRGYKSVTTIPSPLDPMEPEENSDLCIRLIRWYHRFGFNLVREHFYEGTDLLSQAEMIMRLKP